MLVIPAFVFFIDTSTSPSLSFCSDKVKKLSTLKRKQKFLQSIVTLKTAELTTVGGYRFSSGSHEPDDALDGCEYEIVTAQEVVERRRLKLVVAYNEEAYMSNSK